MLFDLKGKRKRVVQVSYVALAILFGGSLVLFGTGSSVSGGLIDAITGNNGGGSTSVFHDQVNRTQKAVQTNPKNQQAWLDLARTQFNLAASVEGSDAKTGQLTTKGRQAVLDTISSWERYLKLHPKKPDASTAQFAALAYGATQDYKDAVKTQAIAAKGRPSASSYYQLAQFAYAGGDVRSGDAAAKEAVRRTPKDLRNSVTAQVKDVKKQGLKLAAAIKARQKAQRKASKGKPGGTAFGPLPGASSSSGSGP
jgi:tetratricopeptide (TPR) repeat protein